jgi:hypothetical protein
MFKSEKQISVGGFSGSNDLLLCCPHCGALLNINELF